MRSRQTVPVLIISFIIAYSSTIIATAQPAPQQTIKPDPPQYGKPFTKVPDRRDVTLYQVNMRAFSKSGDFNGVTARLDSIKALGVNVLYLMPHYPVGKLKTVNSPYCIQDYKAVNSEFGTLDDLRNLVAGAHQRNMAVILDWVANHTSFDNVWIKNKAWYQQDSGGKIISPPGTSWNDVAQLDFRNADMRLAMIDAMKYWVLAADVDGYRCDFSDGPPIDFWAQAFDTLKRLLGRKLLMLSEGRRSDLFYKVGFDWNYGFRYFDNLKTIFAHGRSVRTIDSLNVVDYAGATDGQQILRYTSNHDVNGSDGTPEELFGGERGAMAAFVVVAYMKGIPMIYNGQEVGTPYRLVFPFTAKDINWSLNPQLTAEYKKLIVLRNKSEAIRRGQLTSFSTDDVCAFIKESGNEKVAVFSNFRNKAIDFVLPSVLAKENWLDAFTGKPFHVGNPLHLEPFAYLVLKKK